MAKIISIKKSDDTAEKEKALAEEIKNYEALVKSFPRREEYYNRLMILYRKNKNLKKELALIEKGIKIFSQLFEGRQVADKNIIALSKKINKAAGLIDAKGNPVHVYQPVDRWEKRKAVLAKKIENS